MRDDTQPHDRAAQEYPGAPGYPQIADSIHAIHDHALTAAVAKLSDTIRMLENGVALVLSGHDRLHGLETIARASHAVGAARDDLENGVCIGYEGYRSQSGDTSLPALPGDDEGAR